MAWPTTAVVTGDLITAAQLNGLPVKIADSTAGSAVATFDFTSIPSHYAHLFFIAYLRGDTAAGLANLAVRFNNDSGANYDAMLFNIRDVATLATVGAAAATSAVCGAFQAGTAPANSFGPCQIWVPHYANAVNHKTVDVRYGMKLTTASTGQYTGGGQASWRSTAAINRVTLLPSAGNFDTGSRVTLYGYPG